MTQAAVKQIETLKKTMGAEEAPGVPTAKNSVVVMPFTTRNSSWNTVAILNELVLNGVQKFKGYEQVLGTSELEFMLGVDALKQAMDCNEISCPTQSGGTLGAELILAGCIEQRGNNIISNLKKKSAKAALKPWLGPR
ncbi:MAG: hypothetical protein VYA34_03595 [Myxococcota bacterium]|nr:hypothetical protein [Myxococcota bacterium]